MNVAYNSLVEYQSAKQMSKTDLEWSQSKGDHKVNLAWWRNVWGSTQQEDCSMSEVPVLRHCGRRNSSWFVEQSVDQNARIDVGRVEPCLAGTCTPKQLFWKWPKYVRQVCTSVKPRSVAFVVETVEESNCVASANALSILLIIAWFHRLCWCVWQSGYGILLPQPLLMLSLLLCLRSLTNCWHLQMTNIICGEVRIT